MLELLQPEIVAVVGASKRPNTFGERSMRHFRRHGFRGRVFAVNPGYDEIDSWPCFPSIPELPEVPDTAVLAIPKEGVLEAIAQLGQLGCRHAVVMSSGYAESGTEGAVLQNELASTAIEFGVTLLGPNCNGAVNVVDGVPLGVSSMLERESLVAGRAALVCQSGSLAASISDLAMDAGLGLSYVVAIGNAVDIDAAACFESFAYGLPD